MLKREMLKRAMISKKLIYGDIVGCDCGEGEIIVNASINFHRVIVHTYIFRFSQLMTICMFICINHYAT